MSVPLHAITRAICRKRYFDFFTRAWHIVEPSRPLVYNWHIEYLCDLAQSEIERIAEGRKKEHDYIINMPFRALKSHIFSVFLHPWAWINYPWLRFTTVSYSSNLSLHHSNNSQKIIDSAWYQTLFGDCFQLKSTISGKSKLKETESYYENNRGGYRFVSSVSGGSTGYGGDVNIADDILKRQDADSKAARTAANTFWTDSYKSRVSDFDVSVFFLIMQRLHDDDPTGHTLQKMEESPDDVGRVFHVCLPAENIGNINPPGLAYHYKNGLMFPERFSRDVIDRMKSPSGIGVKATNAQLNQNPVRPGGNLFHEQWFVRETRATMPKRKSFTSIRRYYDTAFTEKETNSACAFVEFGKIEHDVYLLDCGFEWYEFPEQIKWIKTGPGDVMNCVEAKATGKSTVQVLKRAGVAAVEIEIEATDKVARANAISLHVESERVHVPEWLWDQFLNDARQGILKFPDGTHDDLTDAFVMGITDLLGVPSTYDQRTLDKMLEYETSHVY